MGRSRKKPRTASLKHERDYYRSGYRRIVGMDEAGRGPLAGPLYAAAVALPLDRSDLATVLRGVRDSKQMTPLQREKTAELIIEVAVVWGIGSASAEEINRLNLTQATRLAMSRALEMALQDTDYRPDCLFLDYMAWPEMGHIHQLSIVGGDQLSLSIAAASVLAKTRRDAYMVDIAEEFPHYGFADNKGYGTPQHLAALREFGPSPIHRLNYRPVQQAIQDRT